MAYLGNTFDAQTIEPSTAYELLPAGKYHAQIVNSEMRDTKSGGGQYLWLEICIIEGQHNNKRLFDRLNLVNNNEKAVEIAQRTLSAICHAIGQMQVTDSEQLHNKTLVVNVKVRPEGPDRQGIIRPAQNEIGGYESVTTPRGGAAAATTLRQDVASAEARVAPADKPAAAPWRRTAG